MSADYPSPTPVPLAVSDKVTLEILEVIDGVSLDHIDGPYAREAVTKQ